MNKRYCFLAGMLISTVVLSVPARKTTAAEAQATSPAIDRPEPVAGVESPEQKDLLAGLEKESRAAEELRVASLTALDALSKTAIALDKVRMELVGTHNVAQARQLAITDMELEEFDQALDRLSKALTAQEPSPEALLAELAACRKAVQVFGHTASLSEEQILDRLKKDNPQTAKDIEDNTDAAFGSMMMALLLSKWLAEEADQAFASSLTFQDKVSRTAQDSNQKVLKVENEIFFSRVKAQREAQFQPMPPAQQAQPANEEK